MSEPTVHLKRDKPFTSANPPAPLPEPKRSSARAYIAIGLLFAAVAAIAILR